MPEYLPPDAKWESMRTWEGVRQKLRELRDKGEDCGTFSVRTDEKKRDEERADAHPETRSLFAPAPTEAPAPAGSDLPRVAAPGPSGRAADIDLGTRTERVSEARANRGPESRDSASGSRAPAQPGSEPPVQPPEAGEGSGLADAIRRVNAGADYHEATERRRGWVREWVDAGADRGARTPEGWTPLHFAAAGGWGPELVAALVDAGLTVDARDDNGWTPLHVAARHSSPEVAQTLLAGGAAVDARDRRGWTPLHEAARAGAPKVVARMVAVLAGAGATVDARTENQWTPLHLAAWHGPREAIAALIAAGADVDAQNKDAWTPLHLAARYGRSRAIAGALVGAGADPDLRNADDWTPLHLAAAHGGVEFVKALLAAGADVHALNRGGATALALAGYRQTRDIVVALHAAGASAGPRQNRASQLPEAPMGTAGAALGSDRFSQRWEVPGAPGWSEAGPTQIDEAWSSRSRQSRHRRVGARQTVPGGRERVAPLPPAGLPRPRRRWRKVGVFALLMAVVVYALNDSDDGPSSPPARDGDAAEAVAPQPSGAEADAPATSREAPNATSTNRGGTTAPRPRETTPPAAAATARGPAANPPGTRPRAAPVQPAPSRSTPSPRTVQPQATTAPPAAEDVEPARPDPPPVVEPVRVGGNVPQPRKTWNVTPEYPRLARLRRNQGIVILEVTVDRQGEVSNVSVLRSAEGLDEAAVEAVREWRYEPTIMNGRPVSVVFTETVRFQIQN